ncbi:dolichyl pyrophosphate Glc1Man9GlcNAc2 alpha-1,3-glucosyltransferase [Parasteatoda tepidariorum]|uniref:dolichyl pyrophosphate Glc1Man9GlcNAc2 alpha-1,3-glucosyltransferase n=1 Tax=Parasteatoda tepidariorum TaxID=114398 RepID=UPI00077FDA3D|nr:probable dolichyl pyrophosphate Glc1Man9GlcNAc2 alpha-1,3-glucosyltransferase [Parasteatoda tepidariorum]
MFINDCLISFIAVSCLKLLFLPLYKSTDFEVHRNWMAITFEKPFKEWYLEETSQWTLDYPPFFAWFEYLLAFAAKYFDANMLKISNLNYSSLQTVFFMRLSVIISDIVYCYGVNRIFQLIKSKKGKDKDPWLSAEVILAMLLLWNPGLLLVDHIHFQYNGFLNGFLFLSIADMLQGNYVRSAFWFSVLLNLKHIYLYLAPAYFVFLLKNYCFKNGKFFDLNSFSVERFLKLGAVGIATVLVSFGPFIYLGQLNQVLSRLFPVQRGLTHSYWAPNVWALYNFADRILSFIAYRLKIYSPKELQTCSTKGLVQECEHAILPTISSNISLVFTLISLLPMIWLVWKKPGTPKVFLNSIILCSFGTFLFGYHVHEKAILLIILPLTISAVLHKEEVGIYAFLSILGHFSLFPLLHEEGETLLKVFLLLLHAVYMFSSLGQLHNFKQQHSLLSKVELSYLGGLVLLQLFYSFGSKLSNLETKLPFLPLMLISTYCALGVLYIWIKYCFLILPIQSTNMFKVKKK